MREHTPGTDARGADLSAGERTCPSDHSRGWLSEANPELKSDRMWFTVVAEWK
jgi:hypothetical protein